MVKYKLLKWYPSLPKNYEVGNLVQLVDGNYCDWLTPKIATRREVENNPEFWEKIVEKEPIFTTEDGVEIFVGDTVYYVLSNLSLRSFNPIKDDRYEVNHYFSTEEKAEEYIELNTLRFSINDLFGMSGPFNANIYGGPFIGEVIFEGILKSDIEILKQNILNNKKL